MGKSSEQKHIKCIQKCNNTHNKNLNKMRQYHNKKAMSRSRSRSLSGGRKRTKQHKSLKKSKSKKSSKRRRSKSRRSKSRRSKRSKRQRGAGFSVDPRNSIAGRAVINSYSNCRS
jgi:hypothetical protein